MQRLVTLGFTLDMVADVASVWTDTSTEGLATTVVLGGLLPAAAALYAYVIPATASDPADFQAATIRR
jgi:hypothetical protein